MLNVYIYCEGPTEESFINEVLYPYFFNIGIFVFPIVCTPKRTALMKYRGGVSDYNKIKQELTNICKSHRHEYVTTMFDYYGMPENTPEIGLQDPDIFERIEKIETAINQDIGQENCMFHLMLHEFEGILFSDPQSFASIAEQDVVDEIRAIRDSYPTPEHINNSPETAPSKRLKGLIPNYAKIRNGTLISKEIGIDKIMEECPHFRSWIERITSLESIR